MRKQRKQRDWRSTAVGVLACAFLGALLLSACSSSTQGKTTNSSSANSSSTSAISQTLLNQGSSQLQTFQQWIALMQQYGGNSASYQQQYNTTVQPLTSGFGNTMSQSH